MTLPVKLAERPRRDADGDGADAPTGPALPRPAEPAPRRRRSGSSSASWIATFARPAARCRRAVARRGDVARRSDRTGLRGVGAARLRDHGDQPQAGATRSPTTSGSSRRRAARRRADSLLSTIRPWRSAALVDGDHRMSRPAPNLHEITHPGHRRRGGDPRVAADDPRVRGLRRARGVERPRRAGAGRARGAGPGVPRRQDAGHGRPRGAAAAADATNDDAAGGGHLRPRHRQHRGRGDQGGAPSTSSRSRSPASACWSPSATRSISDAAGATRTAR